MKQIIILVIIFISIFDVSISAKSLETENDFCNLQPQLEKNAEEYAEKDVWNYEMMQDYSKGETEDEKSCFQQKYREFYKNKKYELAQIEESIVKEAYKKGVYDLKKSDNLYSNYKGYKAYEIFDELYQETYLKGKQDLSKYITIIILFIILTLYLVVIWIRSLFNSDSQR